MVYKEIPLCSQGSAFGHESAESLPAYLINLLPENFGALSVSVSVLLQQYKVRHSDNVLLIVCKVIY
jgi:hypothetical protein